MSTDNTLRNAGLADPRAHFQLSYLIILPLSSWKDSAVFKVIIIIIIIIRIKFCVRAQQVPYKSNYLAWNKQLLLIFVTQIVIGNVNLHLKTILNSFQIHIKRDYAAVVQLDILFEMNAGPIASSSCHKYPVSASVN